MRPFHQIAAMLDDKHLLARFWRSASTFWRTEKAIALLVFLFVIVLLQLVVQVLLNIWNREFFDALGHRDSQTLWLAALYFIPLAGVSILLATTSVWARMTTQRSWREAMTRHVLNAWLAGNRFDQLHELIKGAENPEYRISYDVRIATDAPIDMALSFFSAILTSITFFGILWTVGGSIAISFFGLNIVVPGYLVIGVIGYSGGVSFLMHLFGHHLAGVSERVNQAEAEFRSEVDSFRERGNDLQPSPEGAKRRQTLQLKLQAVLLWWREYCWQLVRTTLVSHANFLFAPVVAWILCAPKYLSGDMSLGELTQSAAAFVVVQSAFNWLVDNYTRLADWQSSAHRVATLLLALDEVEAREGARVEPVQP